MVQIPHVQRAVRVHPFPLRLRKGPRRNADRIVFCPERVDIVGLFGRQQRLCGVQLRQQVRPADADTEIVIGCAEDVQHFRICSAVRAVALRCEHICPVRIKSFEQLRIVCKGDDLCRHMMAFKVLVQDADHDAVQHADAASVQCRRICRDLQVLSVPHEVIGFVSHDRSRVADQPRTVFSPCQAGQQIDIPVEQHLVELAETAVDVLISPAGVLGKLLIVFVGIARLYRAFLCPLLEHLVFIIAYPHRVRSCLRAGPDGQKGRHEDHDAGKKRDPVQQTSVISEGYRPHLCSSPFMSFASDAVSAIVISFNYTG